MNLPAKLSIAAATLLASASISQAEVNVSPIFSDNMVLQQQATVTMHGKATPGNNIKVKTSWNGKTVHARAEADSTWSARFDTPSHGGPYTITVSDRDSKIVFDNILTGDVWVCGGQSNMEMPISGFSGQPVEGSLDM
ncbi:MAG: sialate O-acetylesterase, partial [Muribaculaceae bacterium]|nr:sialate O-acetylesterase [Muribaculaceae bacterium]